MKGIQLKEKTALGRAAELARRLAASRAGRAALEALAWGAGSFLLADLPLLGGAATVAACLPLCVGAVTQTEGRADCPRCRQDDRTSGEGRADCPRYRQDDRTSGEGRADCPRCRFGLLNLVAALVGACGGYVLFWGWELALEPLALTLSSFAGAVIFRRTPASRSLLAASLSAAVGGLFLLDTGFGLLPLLRLGLGAGLAALTPVLLDRVAFGRPAEVLRAAPGQPPALPAQKAVEKALRTMHGVLAREDPVVQPLQLAEVYDFAAEQVCRCCVRGAQCWEQNAEDTYRDLCAAGEAIVQRGAALREDLPERFTDRCCHTEGFLTAVNQSLDAQLVRRREEARRAEGRRVAAGQYLALERLLAVLARPAPKTPPHYAPELAVGSACRVGNELSGDRGATCRDRFGRFYVLLCDGMGTGPGARTESDRAVRLLTAFLETGLEADTALELLNGFYVLRKDAAFATLDLLKLDLRTGDGTLYKWGAAPSCLRRGTAVETIGTATPPPGLEAAEGRVPGQYELSLKEGETLVMVSDGAWGEETARRLSEFAEGSVRDLASCLITLGENDASDDRTVVVVRLRPLDARP